MRENPALLQRAGGLSESVSPGFVLNEDFLQAD